MTKRAAIGAAAVVGAAVVLAALIVTSGLRFYTVMTPSMGITAPVGTLVVTRAVDGYQVGEIVTYEREGRSYTHRIVAAEPDGTFVTKGDLNSSPDPLPVSAHEIVGRVIWIAPGLGWLWQGLPWLALGGVLIYALSLLGRFDQTWRWVIRISGWTLVVCLVAFWLHPWVSLSQLAWAPSEQGGVDMHVVNTGVFPLDVLGNRLVSGQDAIVRVTEQDPHGYYTLTPGLAFRWWEQAALFLLCLTPLALSLLIRDKPYAAPARMITDPAPEGPAGTAPSESDDQDAHGRPAAIRRPVLIVALILSMVVGVAVVTFSTTSAALTARVTNSADKAGSRTFFTCANAVSSLGRYSSLVAYAMGTASTTSAADLSGNGYTGTFARSTTTYATSIGCHQDTPKAAVTFNGSSQCLYLPSTTSRTNPGTFSLEAWFRATSKSNGVIVGFNSSRTGVGDANHDRKIYLDKDGRVVFGVYPGSVQIISSPAGTNYADGNWHHVAATFSASTGMRLYLDGALASSDPGVTTAQDFTGYWKIGCGNLSNWRNAATDDAGSTANDYTGPSYYTGQLQFVAVHTVVLTATQVKEHYQAGMG